MGHVGVAEWHSEFISDRSQLAVVADIYEQEAIRHARHVGG